MQLPRFSENLALNNTILVVIATSVVLVGLGIALALIIWSVRRAAKASNVGAVEQAVERIWRPIRLVSGVLGLLVVLAACGLLGVSVWREMDLQQHVDTAAGYLTWSMAWLVVRVTGTVALVIIGSLWLRRSLQPYLPTLEQRLLGVELLSEQTDAVHKLVSQLKPLLNIVLLYVAFNLAADWVNLPTTLHWLVATAILFVLVLNGARMVMLIVHLMCDSLDRFGHLRLADSRFGAYYEGVRGLWPLTKRSFEAITYLAAASLVIGEFGALSSVAPYGPKIINLIGIFFLARVIIELSHVLVADTLTRGHTDLKDDAAKRRVTLVYLIQSVLKYIIYFGAVVFMMREIGIDPTPFLAGAGIIGLTVGLGAQKLVNDMVSGFFILFEGQILAGDYVRIGESEGIVEQVYLRVTLLRDNHGRLHTIRNGNIESVVNYSKQWVNAVVDIGVAYEMNLDKCIRVILETGRTLAAEHPDVIIEEPRVLGVNELADSAVVFRTATKVRPGQHLPIERAFRKAIKEAFNAHDIEIPYPRQVEIHIDQDGNPVDDH